MATPRCTVPIRSPLGSKVAHIDNVRLGYARGLAEITLPILAARHRRFLVPSNILLVPKQYAGVAETHEFIAAFRTACDAPSEGPRTRSVWRVTRAAGP